MEPTDEQARECGFLNAADMAHFTEAMVEERDIDDWIEAGMPSVITLWRQVKGLQPVDVAPLTVQQAAERMTVSPKWIRRRLPALEAMEPKGAYRTSEGARAPWRIIPAALDRLGEAEAVEPGPTESPRARRKPAPKKRSSTGWRL